MPTLFIFICFHDLTVLSLAFLGSLSPPYDQNLVLENVTDIFRLWSKSLRKGFSEVIGILIQYKTIKQEINHFYNYRQEPTPQVLN